MYKIDKITELNVMPLKIHETTKAEGKSGHISTECVESKPDSDQVSDDAGQVQHDDFDDDTITDGNLDVINHVLEETGWFNFC